MGESLYFATLCPVSQRQLCSQAQLSVAGTMRGRVVKPTAEKRSAEVLDGIVAYPDANGVECFAAFGAHQVLHLGL